MEWRQTPVILLSRKLENNICGQSATTSFQPKIATTKEIIVSGGYFYEHRMRSNCLFWQSFCPKWEILCVSVCAPFL